MKKNYVTMAAVVLSISSMVIPAKGQQNREIDVAVERISGDKMRGPATLTLKNLNILRYDIQIGTTVTFTAGPDLTLPFIPPIPSAPAGAQGGQGQTQGDPISDKLGEILRDLDSADDDRVQKVEIPIGEAVAASNTAKRDLEALALASDSLLKGPGGPQAIINGISPVLDSINNVLGRSWPDRDIILTLAKLDKVKTDLLKLPATPLSPGDPTWAQWSGIPGNKAAYDATLARVEEIKTRLKNLDSNSEAATKFREAQAKFSRWRLVLIGVHDGGPSAFNRTIQVGCGFAFDQTKSTKVEVIKRDRLEERDEIKEEIITVECTSPFSVSAGFGFSSVDEREFVFVQSTKPGVNDMGEAIQVPVNIFGFKNRSSFRTLPVILLNTRFWEPNDNFALHASAGAAVDIKTGEAGTDVEFIVGPSFSFKRSFFITPGLHIGRVPTLVGGFELNQEVPEGINEPPIEKTWRKGFVVTFTFKIR